MAEAVLRGKALIFVRGHAAGKERIRIKTSHSCEREWILERSPRTRLVFFVSVTRKDQLESFKSV